MCCNDSGRCYAEWLIMVKNGHEILDEKDARAGSGYVDNEYIAVEAAIIDTPAEINCGTNIIKEKSFSQVLLMLLI